MDPEKLKDKPKNFLCFLSFGNDGAVHWARSIGQPSEDLLQELVNVFRASVSLSSAFQSVTNDGVTLHQRLRLEEQIGTGKATFVSCKDETMIVAKPSIASDDAWFGLIGRPLAWHDEEMVIEALKTFEDTAWLLYPLTENESEKLVAFCASICRLVAATPLWNDHGRVVHIFQSVEQFCKGRIAERRSDEANGASEATTSSVITIPNEMNQTFCAAVRHQYEGSEIAFCIFSPGRETAYTEQLTRHHAALLRWYFATFLNLGFRALNNVFFHRDSGGLARLWYKRNEWVLFARLADTRDKSKKPSYDLRNAANCLIDSISRDDP